MMGSNPSSERRRLPRLVGIGQAGATGGGSERAKGESKGGGGGPDGRGAGAELQGQPVTALLLFSNSMPCESSAIRSPPPYLRRLHTIGLNRSVR